MRRIGLILALVLLCVGMAAAQAPPNILEGHEISAVLPDLVLVFTDTQAGITWAGPLVLQIDGRDSARIALPVTSSDLPRRPWTRRDTIKVTVLVIAAAGLGGAVGHMLN